MSRPAKIMPAEHVPGILKALGVPVTATWYAVNALHIEHEGVTQEELDAAVAAYDHLASVKAEEVAKIKAAAGAVILDKVPLWKQLNLTARGIEFLDKREAGGTLTIDEEAEQTYIKAVWAWVKSVRAYSDSLEADTAPAGTEAAARAVLTGASWHVYNVEG